MAHSIRKLCRLTALQGVPMAMQSRISILRQGVQQASTAWSQNGAGLVQHQYIPFQWHFSLACAGLKCLRHFLGTWVELVQGGLVGSASQSRPRVRTFNVMSSDVMSSAASRPCVIIVSTTEYWLLSLILHQWSRLVQVTNGLSFSAPIVFFTLSVAVVRVIF